MSEIETVSLTLELPRALMDLLPVTEPDLAGFIREVLVLDLYRQSRISLGKACELLGVNRWDASELMERHQLYLCVDAVEVGRDMQVLEEV